jgi:hypothetical protein
MPATEAFHKANATSKKVPRRTIVQTAVTTMKNLAIPTKPGWLDLFAMRPDRDRRALDALERRVYFGSSG